MNTGKLFVIPSLFSIESDKNLIPSYIINYLNQINEFIVENEKTSRAFLRKILNVKSEDNFIFHAIGKHSKRENLNKIINNCHKGINIGLLSDLGCPSIADPGSNVVQIAHQNNIKVIPLNSDLKAKNNQIILINERDVNLSLFDLSTTVEDSEV